MTGQENVTLERSTVLGPFPLPEIDDAMRERARKIPGQWLAFEDPAAPVDGPVPRFALQGGYEVDADGQLTGRYRINPQYQPSQQVAGLALNSAELVLWRVLHGYNPLGYLVDVLYRAELSLYAEYEGDNRLSVVRNSESLPLLQTFTSDRFLPVEWPHHQVVPGWTVYEAMAESPVFLDLNPGTRLSFRIAIRDLVMLTTERTRQSKAIGVHRDAQD